MAPCLEALETSKDQAVEEEAEPVWPGKTADLPYLLELHDESHQPNGEMDMAATASFCC